MWFLVLGVPLITRIVFGIRLQFEAGAQLASMFVVLGAYSRTLSWTCQFELDIYHVLVMDNGFLRAFEFRSIFLQRPSSGRLIHP